MKTHSAGHVLLYPLFFLTLFGLLLAGFLPRYTEWYRQAQLSCEAERLAGELRLLRQSSRLAVMRYESEDFMLPRPTFRCDEDGGRYWLEIPKRGAGNVIQVDEVRMYHLPQGISLAIFDPARAGRETFGSGRYDNVSFGYNGGTKNTLSLVLAYDHDWAHGKKVIVDAVGRIRVEGK